MVSGDGMTKPLRTGTLDLKIGDWIIWKDEKIAVQDTRGEADSFLEPGMIGRVLSVHDEIPLEDPRAEIIGQEIPPRVLVQFENGQTMLLDSRMKFEKMQKQ